MSSMTTSAVSSKLPIPGRRRPEPKLSQDRATRCATTWLAGVKAEKLRQSAEWGEPSASNDTLTVGPTPVASKSYSKLGTICRRTVERKRLSLIHLGHTTLGTRHRGPTRPAPSTAPRLATPDPLSLLRRPPPVNPIARRASGVRSLEAAHRSDESSSERGTLAVSRQMLARVHALPGWSLARRHRFSIVGGKYDSLRKYLSNRG